MFLISIITLICILVSHFLVKAVKGKRKRNEVIPGHLPPLPPFREIKNKEIDQKYNDPKRKAIVLGGNGYIGKRFVSELLRCKLFDELVVVDLAFSEQAKEKNENSVSFVQMDCSDLNSIVKLRKIVSGSEVVFNLIGVIRLDDCYGVQHKAHVVATYNVLNACLEEGVRNLIHTSSTSVIASKNPVENATEEAPFPQNFLSHYGKTKAEGEMLVNKAYSHEGLRTVILRFPAVYGIGDPITINSVLTFGSSPPSGNQNYCLVENAIEGYFCAYRKLIETPHIVGGKTYFIHNGPFEKAEEFGQKLVSEYNKYAHPFNQKPKLTILPLSLCWTLALLSEFLFFITNGYLAKINWLFSQLTRQAVDHVQSTYYFSIEAAKRDLKYKPLVEHNESLRIIAEHYAKKDNQINPAAGDVDWNSNWKAAEEDLKEKGESRSNDVMTEWSLLDKLAGPGMTFGEKVLTLLGGICGTSLSMISMKSLNKDEKINYDFFSVHYLFLLLFGFINASAIVQCSTSTSKRWYFWKGKPTLLFQFFLIFEFAFQLLLLNILFIDDNVYFWFCNCAYFAFTVLFKFCILPLHLQRPFAFMSFWVVLAVLLSISTDFIAASLTWVVPTLYLKYTLSHGTRAEPYK